MQKTVLITGANGLLGQKLVAKLANRTAVNLIATSRGENRNGVREGYTYVSLDITDPAAVQRAFETYKPTEVIHCAAMTHVDQCEAERDACWAQNVTAVETLVACCKAHGTRMIHVSTDFIFDGTAGPYSEKDAPNPLSWYGESKLAAEKAVQEAGIAWSIARTVLIYGVIPDSSRSNIVLWAKSQLEAGKEIKVVTDQWRTPTLAEDLADGLILILMKDKTGLYNLSGGELMNIYELVMRVCDQWNLNRELVKPVTASSFTQPAQRPPKTGFIILKAQSELGYRPHTLQEGLAIVAHQLEED